MYYKKTALVSAGIIFAVAAWFLLTRTIAGDEPSDRNDTQVSDNNNDDEQPPAQESNRNNDLDHKKPSNYTYDELGPTAYLGRQISRTNSREDSAHVPSTPRTPEPAAHNKEEPPQESDNFVNFVAHIEEDAKQVQEPPQEPNNTISETEDAVNRDQEPTQEFSTLARHTEEIINKDQEPPQESNSLVSHTDEHANNDQQPDLLSQGSLNQARKNHKRERRRDRRKQNRRERKESAAPSMNATVASQPPSGLSSNAPEGESGSNTTAAAALADDDAVDPLEYRFFAKMSAADITESDFETLSETEEGAAQVEPSYEGKGKAPVRKTPPSQAIVSPFWTLAPVPKSASAQPRKQDKGKAPALSLFPIPDTMFIFRAGSATAKPTDASANGKAPVRLPSPVSHAISGDGPAPFPSTVSSKEKGKAPGPVAAQPIELALGQQRGRTVSDPSMRRHANTSGSQAPVLGWW